MPKKLAVWPKGYPKNQFCHKGGLFRRDEAGRRVYPLSPLLSLGEAHKYDLSGCLRRKIRSACRSPPVKTEAIQSMNGIAYPPRPRTARTMPPVTQAL
jgi:hypothetical protein